MKILKMLSLMALGLLTSLSFQSCSSDDDDDQPGDEIVTTLSTPKYEGASALYNVTDTSSGYESIEFTASGNYVITKAPFYGAPRRMVAANNMSFGFFPKAQTVTRSSSYNNIIYGTYTKKGDTYVLEGFGTITVVGGGSNAVTLEITTNDGESVSVGAQKEQQYSSSNMTNNLCRTWKMGRVRVLMQMLGQTIMDKTYNSYAEFVRESLKMEGLSGDELEKEVKKELEDAPEQVIFTKSGTYIVFYANGELAVSTWKWQNEATGLARYSWNYEHINDPDESGVINISFAADQLLITEYDVDSEDDEALSMSSAVTWFLTEVK